MSLYISFRVVDINDIDDQIGPLFQADTEEECIKFIADCYQDPNRFELAIQKIKEITNNF